MWSQKNKKKVPAFRFVCRSPMKAKYMLLQNEKLEEYMKGELTKTNMLKIKKQKRSSSW
jgi:hypothetical protein